MPNHLDDRSPFFQLARTVLQQANFSLNIHIVKPEHIVSHYDRVQYLLQTLIGLSQIPEAPDVDGWIDTTIRTSNNIVYQLDALKDYEYNQGDEDSAIPHAITVKLDQITTDGRPLFTLLWDT